MRQTFSPRTATAIIIANMVGTGVFTSLGFQLLEINSGFAILMLWVLGGLAAFCGALCYAELGAALPRSGGEYNFLSQIIHPSAGFVSGWISASIGFAAPVALAAITFAAYGWSAIGEPSQLQKQGTAVALVIILTLVHIRSYATSAGVQQVFTGVKVIVIIVFCVAALLLTPSLQPVSFAPNIGDLDTMASSGFAISLIYVSYAYTGWNAATYLSGELEDPQKNLPRVLIAGTLVVALLYIALNATFLLSTPAEAMRGQIEIGSIAAQTAFGEVGGRFTGAVLAVLLISTVSAMTVAGPRVLQMIGQDFKLFKMLGNETPAGIPYVAICFQSGLAILFILTASFESILIFSGFTLAFSSLATVLSLFVLRKRGSPSNSHFRTPLFPIPAIVYLLVTGASLVFVCIDRPLEAAAGAGVIAAGFVLYAFSAHHTST